MSTLSFILTLFVAIEFLYILVLQTFLTTSKKTSQLFKIEQQVLQQDKLKTLMKNQGVYNGLLGILLLYGLFFSDHPRELIISILIYMILVALYGAITSQKTILLNQGCLPILALISFIF